MTINRGALNIVEGSQTSGTSKEMEIKLTGVARASLEELLQDYLDFLRARDHSKHCNLPDSSGQLPA